MKRYDFDLWERCMLEEPDGEWVRFEDVEQLILWSRRAAELLEDSRTLCEAVVHPNGRGKS